MKRKKAKEILAESFREIADKKPVDKITITDITDNCDYSSSTFYRQFKDKYDLIAWDYMYRTEEMLSKVGVDGYSWKDVLLDGAKYYQKDKEYLGNLLKHTSGLESFEKYMADFNYRHFREYILKAMGVQNVDRICDQAIRVWCLGTVRLNCEWILGQLDVNAEEMADIYRESLPSVIKEYITD